MKAPLIRKFFSAGGLVLAGFTTGVLGLGLGTAAASESIISVNIAFGNNVSGNTAIDGEETFGVAAEGTVVGNWNNVAPFSNQGNLIRDDGSSSGVEAQSRNGGGEQFWGADYINTPWNYGLAHYSGTGGAVSIQLSNLETEFPGGYYVIVYVGGAPANTGAAVSDGTTTYFFQTLNPRSLTPVQITDTADDGVYQAGNYAVFGSRDAPLTADRITFRIPTGSVLNANAGIGGLQVVGLPNDFVELPLDVRFGSVRYLEVIGNLTYSLRSFRTETMAEGDPVYGNKPAVIKDRSDQGRDGRLTRAGLAAFSGNGPGLVADSITSLDVAGDVGVDAVGYKGILGSDPRSVAGWVYPNAVSGGQVIAEWGRSLAGERWTVRLDGARLRTEVQGGFTVGETLLEAGVWSHVAVTFDGESVLDVNLFVNGVKQTLFEATDIAIDTAEFADVRVGASNTGANWFRGDLDEIGIWSRALSEQEVADLAAGAPVSNYAAGLELYYDFETAPAGVITSLPSELSGNLILQMQSSPADLPASGVSPYVGFSVDRPTTVYVAYDENAAVPSWLSNRYRLSPMSVGTTLGTFNLWERSLGAREEVALLFDRDSWTASDNNAWVILSESPEAITAPIDDLFVRSAFGGDDWRLQRHHWTLTTGADSPLHTATMLSNVTNLVPEQGFAIQSEIRVPRLQEEGDNAVGFVLLGEGDEAIRAEWLPRTIGGGSQLRWVDASGQVLAQSPWNGLVPSRIDNNVGMANGGGEVVFEVGTSVFTVGENLLNEDFASGGAGWFSGTNNGTANQWEIGMPTSGPGSAFEGQNVAATKLGGVYATDADSWLRSPIVDLTEVAGATLRFQEFVDIDTEIFQGDFAHFVTVSVVQVDAVPETSTQIDKYSETISAWSRREFDLSEFAGQRIALEFRLVSDEFNFNAYEGWHLDQIQVIPAATISRIVSMPANLTLDGTLNGLATAREDLSETSETYLQFTVADRAAEGNPGVGVYVAWDQRASGLEPNWLRNTFTRTDHFVGVSEPGGRHRLWVREYADGDQVTLGGASATGAGPFTATTRNYFVLFGDARPGLDSSYTLTAEGIRADGSWTLDFSLRDASGYAQTLSAGLAESREGQARFGLMARHPAPANGDLPPVWEILTLTMESLVVVGLAGFDAWREEFFPGQLDQPEISGPNAAPAGDGVGNLLKYALGLPPLTPVTAADLPLAELDGDGNLILVYWERKDVADIDYIPEASTDLIEWRSGDPDVLELFRQEGGNATLEEVGVVGGFADDTSRGFLRLRVVLKE